MYRINNIFFVSIVVETTMIQSYCMHGVWKSQKKISFNIASEASYLYILSGQKLIKNDPFLRVFKKPEACGQTVLPDRSVLRGQKNGGKCKNSKTQ